MNYFLDKRSFSSKNLFNEINRLAHPQIRQLMEGLQWMTENFPRSVLIGGAATVHYLDGGRELTPDFDFLTSEFALLQGKAVRENLEFHPLINSMNRQIGLVLTKFNIDFLDAEAENIPLHDLVLKSFQKILVGGFQIKIVNPELLTIMKLELGREKDLEDAFLLIKSNKLKKDFLRIMQICLG
jgi:predicted nucleotidyltransferase